MLALVRGFCSSCYKRRNLHPPHSFQLQTTPRSCSWLGAAAPTDPWRVETPRRSGRGLPVLLSLALCIRAATASARARAETCARLCVAAVRVVDHASAPRIWGAEDLLPTDDVCSSSPLARAPLAEACCLVRLASSQAFKKHLPAVSALASIAIARRLVCWCWHQHQCPGTRSIYDTASLQCR